MDWAQELILLVMNESATSLRIREQETDEQEDSQEMEDPIDWDDEEFGEPDCD